jgi:phage shock protein C
MEPNANQMSTDRPRALRRSVGDRMVAGVAAGVAEHFGLDVTIVRIAFVVLSFLGGAAVPLYVAAWLLIPEEGSDTAVADDLLRHARTG